MSDTEDGSFDKEAEREKLREQLAAEERGRESTQRMSELLLKGATMTNRHCEECGDPIFRHDGQEFCPTCQRPVADAEGDQVAADPGERSPGEGESNAAPDALEEQEAPVEGGVDQSGEGPAADPSTPSTPTGAAGGAAGVPGGRLGGAEDLRAARASLVGKLTALATEAEETADLDHARDLLAAVKEGAEALEALEIARRRR